MPTAKVEDLTISYELIGVGSPWVLTPGGRFSKDSPGVQENPTTFMETMERWTVAYCSCGDQLVLGLDDADRRVR